MKKQKNIRKFVSLVLCLALTVSAFSILASAEEARISVASSGFTCSLCGGTARWFPGSTITSSYNHTYFTYNSAGNATERQCTVIVKTYYEGCVCTSCGTQLLENSYVVSTTHLNCGA